MGAVKKGDRVIFCCGKTSTVVNSRNTRLPSLGIDLIVRARRRTCKVCEESWTTAEISSAMAASIADHEAKIAEVRDIFRKSITTLAGSL